MRKNRIIGLLAAVLAVSVAGCGDVESTGFLSLTQVSGLDFEEGDCGAPNKTLVPALAYDAGVGTANGSSYLLGLWLQNSLVANDDTDGTSTGRINTNQIRIKRIEVSFTDRELWGFLDEKIDVSMPFTLDTESEIGWPTDVIPLRYAKDMIENPKSPIRQERTGWTSLPIRIRAVGELLDGTKVESNEFDLTLSVCNLCSGGCPEGYEPKGCSNAQPDLYKCEKAK